MVVFIKSVIAVIENYTAYGQKMVSGSGVLL